MLTDLKFKVSNPLRATMDSLMEVIEKSFISRIPFVRMWLLDLIANNPEITDVITAMRLALESEPKLGVRPTALLARVYKQVTWVREYRDKMGNTPTIGTSVLLFHVRPSYPVLNAPNGLKS